VRHDGELAQHFDKAMDLAEEREQEELHSKRRMNVPYKQDWIE